MITKAVARRKLHALAGTRPAMPGQSPKLEYDWRSELANHFEPLGPIEWVWVGSLAYCLAQIEMLRAQIAGLRHWQMIQACEEAIQLEEAQWLIDSVNENAKDSVNASAKKSFLDMNPVGKSSEAVLWAKNFIAHNFHPGADVTYLDLEPFTTLLGRSSGRGAAQLRQLQVMLHEEQREYDRIVAQIKRSRRDDMRDAVEPARAAYEAKVAGYAIAGLDAAAPGAARIDPKATPDTGDSAGPAQDAGAA